jgi:CelD/BcsL family acetyltransferase involved in cellulose biosynthesis
MVEKLSLSTALPIWQSIQTPKLIFFTYEWHKAWFETEGKDYEPYILLVNNTIIAPFARKENHIILSCQRLSDYSDIIGPEGEKPTAWKEILEYLKHDGIETVHFKNIPQDSATVAYFQSYPSLPITVQGPTPLITLPKTYDAYIESLSKRSEIKRKIRRFEEENTDIAVVKSTDTTADFPKLLTMMKYNPQKKAYISQPMEDFFNKLPTLPDTHLTFLTVAGETVAGRIHFEDEHSIYGYNSGYIPDKYSGSGFYLLLRMIKQAILEGKTTYNFLRGAEGYKYELGAKDFFIYEAKGEL